MVRKAVALLVVFSSLVLLSGCTAMYSEWSPTRNLRRVMIAGEEVKLMQQDVDFVFDIEDYPINAKWTR